MSLSDFPNFQNKIFCFTLFDLTPRQDTSNTLGLSKVAHSYIIVCGLIIGLTWATSSTQLINIAIVCLIISLNKKLYHIEISWLIYITNQFLVSIRCKFFLESWMNLFNCITFIRFFHWRYVFQNNNFTWNFRNISTAMVLLHKDHFLIKIAQLFLFLFLLFFNNLTTRYTRVALLEL